jgi:transcriptional antiterminator RfaH
MKTWLLVYCKPRRDSLAATNLQRQGFTAYSPEISTAGLEIGLRTRLHTRRQSSEPLFPGYVFIHVDPGIQSISPVRSTRGVLRFVMFGNRFASTSEETIERIRCNVVEFSQRMALRQTLQRGDRIKVNGSGFNDIDAIFCSAYGAERVKILLNVLGRETEVSVPLEFIARAG